MTDSCRDPHAGSGLFRSAVSRRTPFAHAARALVATAAVFLFASRSEPADAPAPPPASTRVHTLNVSNKPWTGDFPEILKRKMLRVLVPYSRTLYYTDQGQERGLTAELARDFEGWVNRKYKTGKRPLTLYLIPTTRDQLLPGLEKGLGEIAAGNLTITDARLRHADFVPMTDRNAVREVVVLGSDAEPVESINDLSGRAVDVRPASSYFESLVALNARFHAEGKPPINLQLVPDALEDEDLMEMANAGIVDVLVVDDWKAKLWAPVLPKIRVVDTFAVRTEGRIGWAIPKNAPKLKAVLAEFVAKVAAKQGATAYRLQVARKRVKDLQNPTRAVGWKRFEQ
ncbi:MAG TPA: transporter substrate-binding domain-containing protein, partial [Thermoanaerobaculia bacterium]|nr:transporter substrate-binding domain-containing protein [Thermoanaerobaculia bacterium]